MADRFPLILNTSANQIQEIASGDTLDLSGTNIKGVGIITATNISGNIIAGAGTSDVVAGIATFTDLRVGGDTSFSEDLVVTGNARVTGILTVGTSSIILNDSANTIKVGTALTLGHTQGLQFHTQNLHSAGFEVNQINVSGASTIGGNLDANGDLDVDGHTNLDNVSIAGVTTFASTINATTINSAGAINLNTGSGNNVVINRGLVVGAQGISMSGGMHVSDVVISKDLDVNGHTNLDNVSVAGVTTFSGDVTIAVGTGGIFTLQGSGPSIELVDANANDDFRIHVNHGIFQIEDATNGNADRLKIDSSGVVTIPGNTDFGAGIDVTGNVIASGNVTGVNGVFSGNVSIGGTLTYEDVTNIDSVGVITARSSIKVTNASANAGNHLEIKTNANSSSDIIKAGAGAFFIKGHNVYIGDDDSNKVYMGGEKDGKSFLKFNNSTKIETTNTGVVATGILTATSFSGGGLKLKDDGADSPILSVMTDDGSPWAFQIGNSTYHDSMSTGTMIYISDSGVGYFNHRGNGAYKQFEFSLNNGTSAHRCITLEPSDQSVKLYCGNNPQMHTMTNGVSLNSTTSRLLWPQNGNSNSRSWGWIGEDGVYGIFELKHSDTNDLVTDKKSIRAYATGSVYLYHNDTPRLQTTSTGVDIPCSSGATIRFGGTSGSIYRAGSPGAGLHFTGDAVCPADGAGAINNNGTNLGTSLYRFKNIYTNDLNLSNEGSTNSIDNTWGDYTIQEGESDLFLINNRSGKKYKFNLTEVS